MFSEIGVFCNVKNTQKVLNKGEETMTGTGREEWESESN